MTTATGPQVPGRPAATPRRGRPGYDREGVLQVAVQLFIEQGYDATSVSDLAARLGLSKSALYHHFSSKEELLGLALDDALGALEKALQDTLASGGTPTERLTLLIRDAVGVLIDRLPAVTLLLRVRGNTPVELAAMERRRRFDQQVTALVRQAQDAGEIRTDVDAAVATRLMFGMLNSVVEWYRPDGPAPQGVLAEDIVTVILQGVGTRNGERA
ncbi:TetR/AcrR family transcriptional regulator [Microbacterium flavum]|uniref:TetR family transcriptional regulator n=1 Tax=Microbacterium flavum TaxID=415216 RepID=A0ABS5XY10_9MICO|nr:TetR/AcrR family transcriptional regulator [Microbacterium flavum]MBT8799291.1 TetR family transcriptional regulator [Microbacterium flavum]